MNGAQLHLLLNHFPILGTLFGLLVLAAGLWKKSEDLQKAALVCFLLVGLLDIPTYLTGEPAEEVVEHLPEASEQIIEEHEDSALVSLIALELLAAASLIGLLLFRRSHRVSSKMVVACLILSILALLMVSWTAYLGGQIRHTETRADFQAAEEAD